MKKVIKSETPTKEERITKRREQAIKLLDKFNQDKPNIVSQIQAIDKELATTEKKLKYVQNELMAIASNRTKYKEQLLSIESIQEEYKEMICEKFNVKVSNINKIRK